MASHSVSTWKPSPTVVLNAMSPFYRPTTPQDDPVALLASPSRHLAVEPPVYLRPTLAQVLIPHHASLDLIPLPNLRDRAIMLSAAMPTVFNIWELKVDIYERGGGSACPRGMAEAGRGNQPWQRESWIGRALVPPQMEHVSRR
ncbi:unnamed protein product [Clonostachys rosea f. rosea IK726]|uniref:Uncharacterized protein n=1 Tax=Clonostachys rosea f. rosea IK726 TaxID=1349383 RepID=A0ACA9UA05_BIOOC|nr:unnamed protein product [Clonostachys rosea f. rosea IK726]